MSGVRDFKSLGSPMPPTLETVAKATGELHAELVELARHMGARIRELEQAVKENNAITDQVIRDLQSQMEFIMTLVRVPLARHGAIAGPDGKVPVEIKTALELYLEGRKAIQERDCAKGLSATETAQRNGAAAPEGSDEDRGFAAPINGQTRHDRLGDDDADPAEIKH